jgi:hypothetical protein
MHRTLMAAVPVVDRAVAAAVNARHKVVRVFLALALAVGGWGTTIAPHVAHAVSPTALILDVSVTPDATLGGKSLEQAQAELLGFNVTVVNSATWAGMTAAQFRSYQLIIIGDPTCDASIPPGASWAAADANQAVWEPLVLSSGGNVTLIGTDPVFHNKFGSGGASTGGALRLVNGGLAFAGNIAGATGAYVDLSCAYSGSAVGTPVPLLDHLTSHGAGQFTAGGAPCAGTISIVASSGPTAGVSDADLSNWGCSVHEFFNMWPSDYTVLALATDPSVPKTFTGTDVETGASVSGSPYIMLRGATVTHPPNITLTPATATNPVGGSHTVTATVTVGGSPAAGITVTFRVESGPNVGKTGTGVTNAAGQATFTYTDTGGAGTDTISATITVSGAIETATATKTWVASTSPTCVLKSKTTAGIVIAVQDTGSGLAATTGGTFTTAPSPAGGIQLTKVVNASVTIPAVASGTTTEVDVTALKITATLSSIVGLKVTDVAGNVTLCDPTLVADSSGRPMGVTVDGSEGHLSIANNGLNVLTVEVNGKAFNLRGISGKTDLTLDISSALHAGSNSVTIHGRGPHGSNAVVVFSS